MDQQRIGPATDPWADLREGRRAIGAPQPFTAPSVAVVDGVEYVNDGWCDALDNTVEVIRQAASPAILITMAGLNEVMDRIAWGTELRKLIIVGEDPGTITAGDAERVFHVNDLRVAVFLARELATPGSMVLYSPATTTDNRASQAEVFEKAVNDL